jgi:cytoskeleton protein RodZ
MWVISTFILGHGSYSTVRRRIMGLASGKAKLKLIDIEPEVERDFTRPRSTPTPGDQRIPHDTSTGVDADSPSVDGATEIGCALRDARERSGQSLQDASRQLRIRLEYLRAIEHGDFKTLPGMTYAIGYVRSYAQYLGLDVERAISLFKTEAIEIDGPRQLVFPSPAPEGKVPGGALMFVAAFLAIFAYVGWYYVTDSGRAIAGYTLPVPESLQSWLDEKPVGGSPDGFTSTAVASSQTIADEGSRLAQSAKAETTVIETIKTARTLEPSATPDLETSNQPSSPTSVIEASAIPGSGSTHTAPADTPATDTSPPALLQSLEISTNSEPLPESGPTPLGSRPAAIENPIDPAPVQVAVTRTEANTETVKTEVTEAAGSPTEPLVAPVVAPVVASLVEPLAKIQNEGTAVASIPRAPSMNAPVAPTITAPIETASSGAAVPDGTRIVITASAASWVQVRAPDSTTIMTKVMRAGDVYEVPDRDGLRLFTGNAGALTILVDGKATAKIGGAGQIARNIDLAPETLQQRLN